MSHEIDLGGNVPIYGQESCCWCGAASAQMIMNGYPDSTNRVWRNQGPPNTPNCWDTIQVHNTTDATDVDQNWCTDPMGLRECLRRLNPPPAGTWNIHMNANRDTVMFNILYWMNRNNFPVAVLINQGGHWVVIVRFESDIEPLQGTNPVLQQITYHDPEPHNVGSTITKTGVQWYKNEWNGAIRYQGTWHNTYVAVIEPPVRGVVSVEKVDRVGKTIIEPKEARAFAKKWIEQLNLTAKAPYGILRKNGIRSLTPILVHEETLSIQEQKESDVFYYIVPFGFSNEKGPCEKPLVRIGIIVNAYTGQFEEIGAFGKPVKYLSKNDAIRIAAKAMQLKDSEIRNLKSHEEIYATLMFRPSEITHIRIYPFWEVKIQNKVLYVDQLGKLYTSIKPSVPGD